MHSLTEVLQAVCMDLAPSHKGVLEPEGPLARLLPEVGSLRRCGITGVTVHQGSRTAGVHGL